MNKDKYNLLLRDVINFEPAETGLKEKIFVAVVVAIDGKAGYPRVDGIDVGHWTLWRQLGWGQGHRYAGQK